MPVSPQKFRELVFQLLYSFDIAESQKEDMVAFMKEQHAVTSKTFFLAFDRMKRVVEKKREIDRLIAQTSKSYEFNRIPKTEKNILRVALFELCYDDQIPPKVAIAEAIRMSRKFATPESALFINAILDVLYKERLLKEELNVGKI